MSDDVAWQPLLRDSLLILAKLPSDQVRFNGPGCLTCDLLNDFDHAREVAIGNAHSMTNRQRTLLEQINATIDHIQEPDYVCGDNTVVVRPVWQQIRDLACEALEEFGWSGATLQPFSETEPGVWRRPPSEA